MLTTLLAIPMPGSKRPITSKPGPKSAFCWVGKLAGQPVTIPTGLIKYLEQSQQLYPIPGADAPLMGLVQDQNQLIPHFDTRHSAATEHYSLILKTEKGDISFAIDEVHNQSPEQFAETDGEVLVLDGLLSGLLAGHPPGVAKAAQTVPVDSKALLLIQAGAHTYAVDPTIPHHVEKHASNVHWRGQSASDRLVQLVDGTLVHGLSLSALLEGATQADEHWSLLVHNSVTGEDTAITASHVLGLEKIPLDWIHVVANGKHKSQWINHPEQGQVEWLDLQSLINPSHDSGTTAVARKKSPVAQGAETAPQPSHDILVPYSGYGLIVPGAMIGSIGPVMGSGVQLEADEVVALPVFSLLGLLGLPEVGAAPVALQRAVLVKTSNGQLLALSVPAVSAPKEDDNALWFEKPALPAKFSGAVARVRLCGQMPQYLLDYANLDQVLNQAVINAKQHAAVCGWLPGDFFNPAN